MNSNGKKKPSDVLLAALVTGRIVGALTIGIAGLSLDFSGKVLILIGLILFDLCTRYSVEYGSF